MTVLAIVVVFVGLAVMVTCALLGGVELVMLVRREPEVDGSPSLIHATVLLIAAAALAASYFVSAGVAERRTGWTDADGDGILAEMVNGRYDYLDINGATLFQTWGLMTASVLACLVFSLRYVAHCSPMRTQDAAQ